MKTTHEVEEYDRDKAHKKAESNANHSLNKERQARVELLFDSFDDGDGKLDTTEGSAFYEAVMGAGVSLDIAESVGGELGAGAQATYHTHLRAGYLHEKFSLTVDGTQAADMNKDKVIDKAEFVAMFKAKYAHFKDTRGDAADAEFDELLDKCAKCLNTRTT